MNPQPSPIYLVPAADAFAGASGGAPRLGESEKQFTSIFEDSAIGMALIAPDSRRLRVNKAFCDMLGYTEVQMLARTVQDITHPDDVAEDLLQRAAILAGEKDSYQREKRYIHESGRVLWGYSSLSLVRDARGEPLHFIAQVQDITERKLAEQALRRSEERFRSLTLLSSDWYWEQDESFRFTVFSGSRQAGPWLADQKTAIGRCRWEIEGVSPINTTWALHRAALEARQPFKDLEYMRAPQHSPALYLACSGEPVFDTWGIFTGYRGTARDITESKSAEQRLRTTQSLLHMAAQIGRLGAWEYDVSMLHVIWSEEVCAIHEVHRGFQPTPEQAIAFFAPECQETMRDLMRVCLHDGSPFDVEAQIVTAKGRRLWARVICEAEWDAQGRVRRLQGACQDISESRQAAEETRLMAEQLTTTLESLTDAFFTIDRDWKFSYLNAQAQRMLRRPREQLLGRPVWEEFPQAIGTVFHQQFERAMAQNVAVQCEEHYAPFDVWLHVKAYPSAQGLAINVKDVTGRIRAQREILRLNAELEERVQERTAQLEAANKELEAFSYSIAHDLRAPLGSIDGFSQMLQQVADTGLSERAGHYLSRIRAGVRQMGDLTDGLLALANLSRTSLRNEPVDLALLAHAAAAACHEGTPGRVVDIRVTPSMPVLGDPRLLAQVLGNLVGNAWKFTAHTPHATIEVGSMAGPGDATVHYVRDNGAGFDMAHASKMFEAFHRLHGAAEFEGTGIGLAIVHKIIARHGGRIWAEAAPQQGATFFFTLNETAPCGTD